MPRIKKTAVSPNVVEVMDETHSAANGAAATPSPKVEKSKVVKAKKGNGAELEFEAHLWSAADTLRGSMDASEYKHVVLGLIFLKYISDSFEEQYAKLLAEAEADPEDRDEYAAGNVFWVPKEARWSGVMAHARSATIGPHHRRRDARHRAREQVAEGGAAARLRAAATGPDAARFAHRPRQRHRPRPRRRARKTSWAGSTSTSSAGSPTPKGRRAANFTRRVQSCA